MITMWQNKGMIGQVSFKSSWELDNWRMRRNGYKRREEAIEEGVLKIEERKSRQEQNREKVLES